MLNGEVRGYGGPIACSRESRKIYFFPDGALDSVKDVFEDVCLRKGIGVGFEDDEIRVQFHQNP